MAQIDFEKHLLTITIHWIKNLTLQYFNLDSKKKKHRSLSLINSLKNETNNLSERKIFDLMISEKLKLNENLNISNLSKRIEKQLSFDDEGNFY